MSTIPTPDSSHERRVAAEGRSTEIVIRGRSAARARGEISRCARKRNSAVTAPTRLHARSARVRPESFGR